MREITVERPHGFMQDSEGKICLRFGNWDISKTHEVPDYVETVKYVGEPAAHKQPVHPEYQSDQS